MNIAHHSTSAARRRLAAAFLVIATAGPGAAQSRTIDPALVHVDSLIAAGRLADARTALADWSAAAADAPGADRAAAGVLRGRLARTWTEAEEAYLSTAVRYPVTAHAPEALLRLGQGLVTAAEAGTAADAARRAVAWLQRLVNDYPTAPARPAGFLWLARALNADGSTPAACTRLRQAPVAAADSITASLIESDRRRLCNDLVPALPGP